MGGHVVVHDSIQGTRLDAVSVGRVDLAFVSNIRPARLLELGVEKDTTVRARLSPHHCFKFKVVPLATYAVFPRPKKVAAFTVDPQGFVFHCEGFRVFSGPPAVQGGAIKKSHPIAGRRDGGQEQNRKEGVMHGFASRRHGCWWVLLKAAGGAVWVRASSIMPVISESVRFTVVVSTASFMA